MDTLTKPRLHRADLGVTIWPADHFTGARLSRRGFQASLLPLTAMRDSTPADVVRWCSHSHRTTEAAKECGRKLWKGVPA